MADGWSSALSSRLGGGDELSAILAGNPSGVLSMTGGFPNPVTFPADVLAELAGRLIRDDPSVALQYTPVEGIASVRDYLRDRQEQLQGVRPSHLMVTSGGMECLALTCAALLDPGDAVVVEAPTYLGALMVFDRAGADVHGVSMDEDGLEVGALEALLESGVRPKFLYTIPEYQNPTGRTLPLERRQALVELCGRHGVLIVEDIAYRELSFDGSFLPTLWSLAPEGVLQAGTFSKIFSPGFRLGWACGPAPVVNALASAKQTTDQCSGALGQRLLEDYGRAGHFESQLPKARELYGSHWRALDSALRREMPDGVSWTTPGGGFLTWLTLPSGLDSRALRDEALEAGVAYVPGAPFYPGGAGGENELRLSFSALGEGELSEAVARLATVLR